MSPYDELRQDLNTRVALDCVLHALRTPPGMPERALTSHEIFDVLAVMGGHSTGISYGRVMYCIGILAGCEKIEAIDWPENMTRDYDKLHWRIKS